MNPSNIMCYQTIPVKNLSYKELYDNIYNQLNKRNKIIQNIIWIINLW